MKAIQPAFGRVLFNCLANSFGDGFEISFVRDRCQSVDLDHWTVGAYSLDNAPALFKPRIVSFQPLQVESMVEHFSHHLPTREFPSTFQNPRSRLALEPLP